MNAQTQFVLAQRQYGPTLPIAEEIHQSKYRQEGESFSAAMQRMARTLSDNSKHEYELFDIFADQRFLPAGRVQSAIGSGRNVTAINCFVSKVIEDDSASIMDAAYRAFMTMRMGGGIGYDFSKIRPQGDLIKTLDSAASGPVSFMGIFDAICATVCSAGHRRGAQMGILRVDHPDIEHFVLAKQNTSNLRNFNISIAITDAFMFCVKNDLDFDLKYNGRTYKTIRARLLWDDIMRSTWDWAEPGIVFIDRINQMNNLWYCETISATNPCAEQPLPPNGACLLGSINMVKYVRNGFVDVGLMKEDLAHIVPAMDNVVEATIYPLQDQRDEEISKRRMGIGVTGMANAIEKLGYEYGSRQYIHVQDLILRTIRDECYYNSALIAAVKGPFPMFDRDSYMEGKFIQQLPQEIQTLIHKNGIRNSHLTSIAPTGTISLTADNVSSGIEPVFSYGYDRIINMPAGQVVERVDDYGVREFGVRGKTADQCSVDDHVNVLISAQKWVDSAVSKTCNVGADVSFEDFKDVYMKAYDGGCKGATTFRSTGKRMGILQAVEEQQEPVAEEGAACRYDAETGRRTCE